MHGLKRIPGSSCCSFTRSSRSETCILKCGIFAMLSSPANTKLSHVTTKLSEQAYKGEVTWNAAFLHAKISIRAKRSISRVFSLFIVPSPFFVHCPHKGRINRAESVLTELKPYQSWFLASVTAFKNGEKNRNFSQAITLRSGITSGLGLCIRLYRYASQLVRR